MVLNIPGGEFLTGSLDVISQSLTIPVLVILLVIVVITIIIIIHISIIYGGHGLVISKMLKAIKSMTINLII